jgi:hypothetical protein
MVDESVIPGLDELVQAVLEVDDVEFTGLDVVSQLCEQVAEHTGLADVVFGLGPASSVERPGLSMSWSLRAGGDATLGAR